ncbi:DoxX family protein, partial [Escherichia coli]|uniref:DoxX family protein n=1 Tax=Escherichia coli TaxID=562 RepID=UPI0021C91371
TVIGDGCQIMIDSNAKLRSIQMPFCIVGALMIVFGFFTRPVSIILCLYTVLASFLGHAFWTMPAELAHGNMIHFYKNICISGGFLALVVSGPGRISVDRR